MSGPRVQAAPSGVARPAPDALETWRSLDSAVGIADALARRSVRLELVAIDAVGAQRAGLELAAQIARSLHGIVCPLGADNCESTLSMARRAERLGAWLHSRSARADSSALDCDVRPALALCSAVSANLLRLAAHPQPAS